MVSLYILTFTCSVHTVEFYLSLAIISLHELMVPIFPPSLPFSLYLSSSSLPAVPWALVCR